MHDTELLYEHMTVCNPEIVWTSGILPEDSMLLESVEITTAYSNTPNVTLDHNTTIGTFLHTLSSPGLR